MKITENYHVENKQTNVFIFFYMRGYRYWRVSIQSNINNDGVDDDNNNNNRINDDDKDNDNNKNA